MFCKMWLKNASSILRKILRELDREINSLFSVKPFFKRIAGGGIRTLGPTKGQDFSCSNMSVLKSCAFDQALLLPRIALSSSSCF